jgi:thioredoxin reductase (NADPH)
MAEGRPVLMTVDDDPSVSRAVARDLRRRYGEQYRIVRAEHPTQGIDALKEIKLRGGRVAAILADYRMPTLNGIEFLEQAMDLFPRPAARCSPPTPTPTPRSPAINVVDVDHYLLKPWDPPEEKLYPVVDSLLETWIALGDAPVEDVQVVGHRWSAPAHAVRDFLARNSVPYRWHTTEDAEGRRAARRRGATSRPCPSWSPPTAPRCARPPRPRSRTRSG